MGIFQKLAFLLTLGTVTFAIRWQFIGRIYRNKRNFTNSELIIITGASSGIGLALLNELAPRGCHLIVGCRNLTTGSKTIEILRKKFGSKIVIDIYELDLSSFASVVSFAQRVTTLDKPIYALVNNAGIFYTPPLLTVNGLEQTFQVNFVSHYLLTLLLLPKLKQFRGNSRVVVISSKAHEFVERFPDLQLHGEFEDLTSNRFKAYQYSKFCLVLFAYRLSYILANSNVTFHCIDPGNVETNIYRNFPPLSNKISFYLQKPLRILLVKTPREGAQGILYALLSKEIPEFYVTKHFYDKTVKPQINNLIYQPILGYTLWKLCRQLCHEHLLEMK